MMALILVLILFSLLVLLLYKYSTKNYNYWKDKNVYQEKPFPLFGNMLDVVFGNESVGSITKKIYDKTNDSTPYFGFYIFQKPNLVLKSTEVIKEVLVKEFDSFRNRSTYSNEKIDPVSANILFTLKNEEWKDLRRKLTPIFTSGKMKMMYPLLKEITDQLEIHLENSNNQIIDVKDLAKRYTIDSISSCAFGINANSINDDNSVIKKMVIKMVDVKSLKRVISMFAYIFCPILVEIFGLTFTDKESAKYLLNVFKDVSEDRKKRNIKRHDVIDCLHAIQQEQLKNDVYKLDDFRLSVQSLIFFNAGSEPGAGIISFLLYELALNNEIQQKLRSEILNNLNEDDFLSYDILNNMKYLNMVVEETLRKYPLVQMLFRQAENDFTFKETGLTIEKGTPILIPMFALHYDPKLFPEPEKFIPERFQKDDLNYKNGFVPFGEGPRKCIGERFAIMQIKIAVAMFLKKFEVSPCEKTDIPLILNKKSFFMTPKSGSIYLNVKKI